MSTELEKYLSTFNIFTKEEIGQLLNVMNVRKVKRNTLIVRQGQICNECYLVLKGCLRQYVIRDGVEKTIEFYTEGQSIVFFSSYANRTPSESYLIGIEDSLLLVGDPEKDKSMYEKFPKLENITRKIMEQNYGKTQDAFSHFITSSPEERYLMILQNRPDLLQRVPQYQLAGYIGITAESLSRIKRRMSKR